MAFTTHLATDISLCLHGCRKRFWLASLSFRCLTFRCLRNQRYRCQIGVHEHHGNNHKRHQENETSFQLKLRLSKITLRANWIIDSRLQGVHFPSPSYLTFSFFFETHNTSQPSSLPRLVETALLVLRPTGTADQPAHHGIPDVYRWASGQPTHLPWSHCPSQNKAIVGCGIEIHHPH